MVACDDKSDIESFRLECVMESNLSGEQDIGFGLHGIAQEIVTGSTRDCDTPDRFPRVANHLHRDMAKSPRNKSGKLMKAAGLSVIANAAGSATRHGVVQGIDIDGWFFIGVVQPDRLEYGSQPRCRTDHFQAELIDSLAPAFLADGGIGCLGAIERPLSRNGERAFRVVADPPGTAAKAPSTTVCRSDSGVKTMILKVAGAAVYRRGATSTRPSRWQRPSLIPPAVLSNAVCGLATAIPARASIQSGEVAGRSARTRLTPRNKTGWWLTIRPASSATASSAVIRVTVRHVMRRPTLTAGSPQSKPTLSQLSASREGAKSSSH